MPCSIFGWERQGGGILGGGGGRILGAASSSTIVDLLTVYEGVAQSTLDVKLI